MKMWYAVYTKPNHEKKVSALLSKKKIENYCPLNKIVNNLQEEKRKPVFEALFPNYVFVYIAEHDMPLVKQQSGVINFVYWLGRPVNIKGMDMENIQEFVDTYSNISLEKTEVSMNNLVRIVSRKPANEEFENVIALHATQVKITLPTLGYVLCADAGEEAYEDLPHQSKLVKV
jgi:transcription antitermination factor NusG